MSTAVAMGLSNYTMDAPFYVQILSVAGLGKAIRLARREGLPLCRVRWPIEEAEGRRKWSSHLPRVRHPGSELVAIALGAPELSQALKQSLWRNPRVNDGKHNFHLLHFQRSNFSHMSFDSK